jgi:hypothetical protein
MSEFGHLEPTERLFIVRHRLDMASEAMITVLELHEQMKVFGSSDFYRKGKGDGAVDLLFDTIGHYELVQICRLWDRCDADGFSLPTIAWLLNSPEVSKLLCPPEKLKGSTVRYMPGSSIDKDFLKFLDEAIKQASASADCEQIERIRNYRDKYIAHPIYRTRKDAKKRIKDLRPADVEFAVVTAERIMQMFVSALAQRPTDYMGLQKEIGEKLQAFYGRLEYPCARDPVYESGS